MVFVYKKLAQFAVQGVLCLPGDQSHPFAQPTINPLACCICWAHLLGRAVFPPWNKGPNSGSYTLMAESEEELKSLLLTVNEESEKIDSTFRKLNPIMASGPITSWQIDGETVETVADFIFLGSQITADGDCNHVIKRRLLLGRKVMSGSI